MSVVRIRLDFQRSTNHARFVGPLLLAVGVLGLAALYFSWRQTANEIAGLELQLESVATATTGAGVTPAGDTIAAARTTVRSLAMPWGQLLDDLEAANRDLAPTVALLEVLPDPEHGKVRLIAETRSLAAALGFLERLQKAGSLVNPLLESHEVRDDVAERPVRVEIVADWRAQT